MTAVAIERTSRLVVKAALAGGTIAGLIDVGVAAGINLTSPATILRVIASGFIGARAFAGGQGAIWLGLVLQLAMSIVIAGVFALGASRLARLRRRPLLAGAAYGIIIFLVMNMIVVPLSAVPLKPSITPAWLVLNVGAMLVFGLLVSLVSARIIDRARACWNLK